MKHKPTLPNPLPNRTMKRIALLLILCTVLSSHDLFIKLDTYFLKPHQEAQLYLFNGTFETTENEISRDRMRHVQMIGPAGKQYPEETQWTDRNKATYWSFKTGEAGTYVAGVSVKPGTIALSAEDFNEYLEHDGVLDVLAAREQQNQLNQPSQELYAKHVKAIFQVGNEKSEHYKEILGYPVEFVPQQNPYTLHEGDALEVQLLENGKPLADHYVYSGFSEAADHDHAHKDAEHHHDEVQQKTDKNGMLSINLEHEGQWYLRCIRMVESKADTLDYESNWATLTFEVR